MIVLNQEGLVEMAVQGVIAHPMRFENFEMDANGRGHAMPSVGGITYNVKVGDSAFGWKADHIEPGVSVVWDSKDRSSKASRAFQFLACTGNWAQVITGAAKGKKGVVLGHHGGVEHVIVDFSDKVLNQLTYDDKIMIRAYGQGLSAADFPDIKFYNCDPRLIKPWGIQSKDGRLQVPVSRIVPASIMGSGIGHADPASGDYDITTQDPAMVKKYALDKIRFGDIVAIENADNTYGRHYYGGAMTIGVVIHSDSIISGHGPGVSTLISSRTDIIQPVISTKANIAPMLRIGSHSKKSA